jgi:hypothetical protein
MKSFSRLSMHVVIEGTSAVGPTSSAFVGLVGL